MLDRFGSPIRVAWPAYQMVWIEAALSLPRNEHTAAFQDIADMTGRSLSAVQSKAYSILNEAIERKLELAAQFKKLEHEAMLARREARRRNPAFPPCSLKSPPLSRLMAGRA